MPARDMPPRRWRPRADDAPGPMRVGDQAGCREHVTRSDQWSRGARGGARSSLKEVPDGSGHARHWPFLAAARTVGPRHDPKLCVCRRPRGAVMSAARKTVAEKLLIKPGSTVWTSELSELGRLQPLPDGVHLAERAADAT